MCGSILDTTFCNSFKISLYQGASWGILQVREKDDRFQQRRLDAFFKTATKGAGGERVPMDVEVRHQIQSSTNELPCFQ